MGLYFTSISLYILLHLHPSTYPPTLGCLSLMRAFLPFCPAGVLPPFHSRLPVLFSLVFFMTQWPLSHLCHIFPLHSASSLSPMLVSSCLCVDSVYKQVLWVICQQNMYIFQQHHMPFCPVVIIHLLFHTPCLAHKECIQSVDEWLYSNPSTSNKHSLWSNTPNVPHVYLSCLFPLPDLVLASCFLYPFLHTKDATVSWWMFVLASLTMSGTYLTMECTSPLPLIFVSIAKWLFFFFVTCMPLEPRPRQDFDYFLCLNSTACSSFYLPKFYTSSWYIFKPRRFFVTLTIAFVPLYPYVYFQ